MVFWFMYFFFKQKTAYEMRISDWSSDVCSSDLRASRPGARKDREDSSIEEGELSEGDTGRAEEQADDSPIGELKDFLVLQVKRSFLEQNKIGRASCRERVCQYV